MARRACGSASASRAAMSSRGRPFGGYRADKVLHESADPEAVVAEARRVLRPGGRIVLTGQDWDTILVDRCRARIADQHERAEADRSFVTVPMFVAAGTRP
ncbi:methyltransferase domain-containing protein [Embleya sp. NPDC055664]